MLVKTSQFSTENPPNQENIWTNERRPNKLGRPMRRGHGSGLQTTGEMSSVRRRVLVKVLDVAQHSS